MRKSPKLNIDEDRHPQGKDKDLGLLNDLETRETGGQDLGRMKIDTHMKTDTLTGSLEGLRVQGEEIMMTDSVE